MTDRALVDLAHQTLTNQELDVWLAKHITGYGRRTGSLAADGQPRCDACGAPYLNKWAHAEECTG